MREEQAPFLEKLDIASVFIRTESGHSNQADVKHAKFESSKCPYRYLIHGTYESNLQSIRTHGLKPRGTRGGRTHVHFVLDNHMTKTLDSVRRESDCLMLLRSDALDDLDPVFTAAGYVLTTRTVPANRFLGVWSLSGTGWIQKPTASEMSRMTDPDSTAEVSMHVALQQWYYDRRIQNDNIGTNWKTHEYQEYLESLAHNPQNLIKFVVFFNKERPRPTATARDNSRNPNRSRRGPVVDKEGEEADRTKREMARRFKEAFRKATAEEKPDPSESEIELKNTDSESESEILDKTPGKPASKTKPKPMPKEKKAPASLWRKKEKEEESDDIRCICNSCRIFKPCIGAEDGCSQGQKARTTCRHLRPGKRAIQRC